MQIWAETGKSALPIPNYSQILYQFLTFTQNLKWSPLIFVGYFSSGAEMLKIYHFPTAPCFHIVIKFIK